MIFYSCHISYNVDAEMFKKTPKYAISRVLYEYVVLFPSKPKAVVLIL
jgi:hypothetical protein